MQLEERPSLRTALAAASCALLGVNPAQAAVVTAPEVDSAVLYYNETDRIRVAEATAVVSIPMGEERQLSVTPMIDSITGASPTGASPTNKEQALGVETTPAGGLPLHHFSDLRLAIGVSVDYPLDSNSRATTGASYSSEKDYDSIGLNHTRIYDFNNKLTTLTLGVAGSLDTISPTSGVFGEGLTSISSSSTTAAAPHTYTRASGGTTSGSSDDQPREVKDKQVVDAVLGLTQVVNRRLLFQLNYSAGYSSGYLTDPYKIISTVDSVTGETLDYLNEKRPDSRMRQSVYWQAVYHLTRDVVRLSYRYFWDDWGIRSHTVDVKYHFDLGGDAYLMPALRYYEQSGADFYHHSLVDNIYIPNSAELPDYASADYRLAAFNSYTVGLKYAQPFFNKDDEVSFRVMYMHQTGDSHPNDAIGVQKDVNLYPDLDAYMVQLGLTLRY